MITRNRNIKLVSLIVGLSVATFVLPGTYVFADDFKRIKTSKQYRAAVVGRTIVGGGAHYIVHADGTITGKAPNGQKFSGTWNWRGNHWCRRGTVGNEVLAHDCQQVFISGNTLRFVRNRGRGKTVEAKIRN